MSSTIRTTAGSADALSIEQQSGAIGAVVTNAGPGSEMDGATFTRLHRALLDHGVICIRGQEAMTPADHLRFAARWGEISIHPYVPSIEGYPGVMRIYDPNPITQTWHSDTTHAARPPSITILLARTIPPYGGDTMWASAYSALEGLSPGFRATLTSLRAVHQGTERAGDAGLDPASVTSIHPVVRTHPETGRPALFVNANYVTHIDGWGVEESAPLLEYLYRQFAKPEYQYRHHWRVGDLVLWDNRCTQHSVVGDTHGAERVLHRITIAGDTPR
ncbi:MAG: TauD/TfdA dioxygenase family protein [Acidimicrobiales bacterium]